MQGPLLSIALIVVLHLISSTNSKFWEGPPPPPPPLKGAWDD